MDDARGLTFVIGDVHGRMDMLAALAAEIEDYALGKPYRLIFLGDYIDRGPDSAGVIGFIRQLQDRKPDRVYCLRGNHEAMLLEAVEEPFAAGQWLRNGGFATLGSFNVRYAKDVPAEVVAWLRALPTFLEDEHRYYVHAGLDPTRGLRQQTDQDRLWMRHPFIDMDHDFGKHVVHGHSPVRFKPGRRPRPDERQFRTNLDTAAVFGGALTAAVFDDLQPKPIGFLQADQDGRIHFDVARRVSRRPADGAHSPVLPGWRVASAALLFALASAGLAGALNGRRHAPALATATPKPATVAKADTALQSGSPSAAATSAPSLGRDIVRPAEAAQPDAALPVATVDRPATPSLESTQAIAPVQAGPASAPRSETAATTPPEDAGHAVTAAAPVGAGTTEPQAGPAEPSVAAVSPAPMASEAAPAPTASARRGTDETGAPNDLAGVPGPVAAADPAPSLPAVPWPTPPARLPGGDASADDHPDAASSTAGGAASPGVAADHAGATEPQAAETTVAAVPVIDAPASSIQPESDGHLLAASSLDFVAAAPDTLRRPAGPVLAEENAPPSPATTETTPALEEAAALGQASSAQKAGEANGQAPDAAPAPPPMVAQTADAAGAGPIPAILDKSAAEWASLARFVGDPDIRERNDPDGTFATASVQPKADASPQVGESQRDEEYADAQAPGPDAPAAQPQRLADVQPSLPAVPSPELQARDPAAAPQPVPADKPPQAEDPQRTGPRIADRSNDGRGPEEVPFPVPRPDVLATIDPAFNPRQGGDDIATPLEPGQSGRDLLPPPDPSPNPAPAPARDMAPSQGASAPAPAAPERVEAPASEPSSPGPARRSSRLAKTDQGRSQARAVIAREEDRRPRGRSAATQRCGPTRQWFFFIPQDCRRVARAAPHRGFLAMLLGGGDERSHVAAGDGTSVSSTGPSAGSVSSGSTGRSGGSSGAGASGGGSAGAGGTGGSSAGAAGSGGGGGGAGGSGGGKGGGGAGGGNGNGGNGNGGGHGKGGKD